MKTYLAKSCDFHSCNAQVLVLFLCHRCYLKDFPWEILVYRASMDPYIATRIESQHRRPVKISQSNTFSTAAKLSRVINNCKIVITRMKKKTTKTLYHQLLYPNCVFLLTRMQSVHSPHLTIHSSITQSKSNWQHPSFYLAYVWENRRWYNLTVQAK